MVTWAVTALWWFAGLAAATSVVRNPLTPRAVEGTALGLVVLCLLPLVTRLCVAALASLGPGLLAQAAAVHRRIGRRRARPRGRRVAAPPDRPAGTRAGTAAAVSAEATALRRLERDIHDGPQQRLVRLAMDLGRAQQQLDDRPGGGPADRSPRRSTQTRETLDELRALSRGIAPPILVDRGLPAALAALAARSHGPGRPGRRPLVRRQRLDPAVETTAYFVVAEALTNVAKHSHASRVRRSRSARDGDRPAGRRHRRRRRRRRPGQGARAGRPGRPGARGRRRA